MKKMRLYKALKIGYLRNENKQKKVLKKFGYILDSDLTNNERVVAYNPFNKKVLFIENGSEVNPLTSPYQFVKDWRSNIMNIPTGTFQYTPRYIQTQNAYLKAKQKYKDIPFYLVGHSQSANVINDITLPTDKAYTLNGALIKQKDNPAVRNFRIENDLVSMFANPNDMTTLYRKGIMNPLKAHNIENIRNEPIFI